MPTKGNGAEQRAERLLRNTLRFCRIAHVRRGSRDAAAARRLEAAGEVTVAPDVDWQYFSVTPKGA